MLNHMKFVHKSMKPDIKKQASITDSLKAMHKSKKTLSATSYEDLNKSLALVCALDLRPISLVASRGFLAFVRKLNPDYKVPCRKTVTKHLLHLHDTGKKELAELLSNLPSASFTTDLWTSTATRAYITVTCHFITTNWQLESKILATRALDERHTGENIAGALTSIQDEFKINNLAAIVTDNAGNMLTAAEHGNFARWPCFSHTLQLAVSDGIKGAAIRDALAFARKLVGHFSHSATATDALKKKQREMGVTRPLSVIQDVCTRWNSQYFMAKRLIELRLPIFAVLWDEEVTKSSVRSSLDLKDQTWKVLEDLIPTLEPLAEATELLTKDNEPTLSQVYVVLEWLLGTLQMSDDDSVAIKKLKKDMSTSLKTRFGLTDLGTPKAESLTSLAMTAMALDPRHKSLKFLSENQRKVVSSHVEKLVAEIRGANADASTVQVKAEPTENPTPKRLRLAEMMRGDVITIDLTKAEGINTEYGAFLREPVSIPDPLEWWRCNSRRFPALAQLAMRYLAIPATEVPSERAFSTAGGTVTKLRAALEPEVVDACVFLHKNYQLQASFDFYQP